MSRDIQYIGMDVHKEAIVIAILNGSGKWSWKPSSKPKPAAFCSSSTVYGASVASGAEWRRAPLLHETVELGQATGIGIAARTCGGPKPPNQ